MGTDPDATPTVGRRWDADSALAALETERTVLDVNIDDPAQVRDGIAHIFREAALVAAMGVVHTAFHEPNPRVRFEAQKYVLDKASQEREGEGDPLAKLVGEIYQHFQEQAK